MNKYYLVIHTEFAVDSKKIKKLTGIDPRRMREYTIADTNQPTDIAKYANVFLGSTDPLTLEEWKEYLTDGMDGPSYSILGMPFFRYFLLVLGILGIRNPFPGKMSAYRKMIDTLVTKRIYVVSEIPTKTVKLLTLDELKTEIVKIKLHASL